MLQEQQKPWEALCPLPFSLRKISGHKEKGYRCILVLWYSGTVWVKRVRPRTSGIGLGIAKLLCSSTVCRPPNRQRGVAADIQVRAFFFSFLERHRPLLMGFTQRGGFTMESFSHFVCPCGCLRHIVCMSGKQPYLPALDLIGTMPRGKIT